ncbi:SLAP domain-containing protein [Lactobacillus helveticus]|uniref:SLAP domain-containing protein n=1 Tax=Lactobacillus helveticus TaxID=1587 RepID=UPI00197BBB8B|nr:SLAP domain-containing protein [Lactobacillus helveticus]MBN6048435.1 SLAP domain-containing protein [Lactobacillus helveticus]
MKKDKLILISMVALMGIVPILSTITNVHTIQAADNSVKKTVMHTSIEYDRNGKNSGSKLYPYKTINVDKNPVRINGQPYYKITNEYVYIKPTNVDGVTRKVTHNTYIYSTSTKRTSFSGRWKLYKGEAVTTYGSSYKFKNGKQHFRIGDQKQYIKAANLSSIIKSNTPKALAKVKPNTLKETTATIHVRSTYKKTAPIFTFNGHNVSIIKRVPNGTKFTVDRLEYGARADAVAATIGSFNGDQAIYHIKGTNEWIYSIDVDAEKPLPEQLYKESN